MKKIIIILSIVMSMIPQSCKNKVDTEFTFRGIPIEGEVNNFVSELEKQGYIAISNNILVGEFLDYEDCYVRVQTDESKSNIVSGVTVMLPNYESRARANADYEFVSELYEKKYGKPEKDIASIDDKAMFFDVYSGEKEIGSIIIYIYENPTDKGFCTIIEYISYLEELKTIEELLHNI